MRDRVLVSEVWVGGPLAEHAGGFAEFLTGQGYTPGSTRLQMHLVAQLSRWLDAEGLDVGELTELESERFIAARRSRVRRLFRSRHALEPVVGYLRGVGTVPAPAPAARLTAVDGLLDRYRRYLLVERAVTAGTAKVYVGAIRPFVASFERSGRLELQRVTAADVSAFVLAEAAAEALSPMRRAVSGCVLRVALEPRPQ